MEKEQNKALDTELKKLVLLRYNAKYKTQKNLPFIERIIRIGQNEFLKQCVEAQVPCFLESIGKFVVSENIKRRIQTHIGKELDPPVENEIFKIIKKKKL